MQQIPFTVSHSTAEDLDRFSDPIIDQAEVMWASRRFILLFGEKAPEVARGEAGKLDLDGKLHVAEMFERVATECQRLLSSSEELRLRNMH